MYTRPKIYKFLVYIFNLIQTLTPSLQLFNVTDASFEKYAFLNNLIKHILVNSPVFLEMNVYFLLNGYD